MASGVAKADIAFLIFCAFLAGSFAGARGIPFSLAVLISALVAAVWGIFSKIKTPLGVIFFGIAILAGTGGYAYTNFSRAHLYDGISFGRDYELQATIVGDPLMSDAAQNITVRPESSRSSVRIATGQIPQYAQGDRIRIRGIIERPTDFRYDSQMAFPKIEIISRDTSSLAAHLRGAKQYALSALRASLPFAEAALMEGIAVGWQGDFSKDFKKDMALSGTTHIVALSGYNIAILVLVVAGLLAVALPRKAAFAGTILAIGFFVLMVGESASVVRAAIMGSLALIAREWGRPYAMSRSIAATAAIMVFQDPLSIAYDVGFQLSFASLLGVSYLDAPMRKFLRLTPETAPGNIADTLATTISAQAGAAPIIFLTFGSVPFVALIANILILPLIPLTMLAGFVLIAASLASHLLVLPVAILSRAILSYEISVIRVCAFFGRIQMPAFVAAGIALAPVIFLRARRKKAS